jgi:hypothetical protein
MFAETEHIQLRDNAFIISIDGSFTTSQQKSTTAKKSGDGDMQGSSVRIALKHQITGQIWQADFSSARNVVTLIFDELTMDTDSSDLLIYVCMLYQQRSKISQRKLATLSVFLSS